MIISAEYDAFLLRTVLAARPYLSELVLVGGCASALYEFHDKSSSGLRPMVTMDIDIAGDHGLPIPDSVAPLAQLMKNAGFREERFGEGTTPVVKYLHPEAGEGLDVEFLCPEVSRRGGHREPSLEIQDGLMAQPLQYLQLLLSDPWRVDLAKAQLEHLPADRNLWVQVPNPAAYIMQKILIHSQREAEARHKDCYYIYEISVTFHEAIESIRAAFEAMKRICHPGWIRTFHREFLEIFADESAEGPRSAVLIHHASPDHVEEARQRHFVVNEEAVLRSVQRLFAAFGLPSVPGSSP
ncbi:MAG: GSU2403 family nucleotidyltransferase fold protein [Planctomycetota bacterium]|nr:GSU2403 family nucleotidyltransferase fold protein [Planctomycetota bacterium]